MLIVPDAASMVICWPVVMRSVAAGTPTTAGMADSRATTAPWDIMPPISMTRPEAGGKRGGPAGAGEGGTTVLPPCSWWARWVWSTTPRGAAARRSGALQFFASVPELFADACQEENEAELGHLAHPDQRTHSLQQETNQQAAQPSFVGCSPGEVGHHSFGLLRSSPELDVRRHSWIL